MNDWNTSLIARPLSRHLSIDGDVTTLSVHRGSAVNSRDSWLGKDRAQSWKIAGAPGEKWQYEFDFRPHEIFPLPRKPHWSWPAMRKVYPFVSLTEAHVHGRENKLHRRGWVWQLRINRRSELEMRHGISGSSVGRGYGVMDSMWYHVEISVTYSGDSGTIQWRVDGTECGSAMDGNCFADPLEFKLGLYRGYGVRASASMDFKNVKADRTE